MPEITLEDIQKKFESLPENLRLAIIVAGVDKKVNTIGREHGLNVMQISELLLKTHIMVFGFIHPDQFKDSVKGITHIEPEVVSGVVKDINEQILKDIKDDLVKLADEPRDIKEIESLPEEMNPIQTPAPEKNDDFPKDILQILDTPTEQIFDLGSNNLSEDQKNNDDILKSAGIEIMSPDDEIKDKNIKNKTTDELEKAKKADTKEESLEKNDEIMKIAFENIEKEEKENPELEIPIEIKTIEKKEVEIKEILSPKILTEIENKAPLIELPDHPVFLELNSKPETDKTPVLPTLPKEIISNKPEEINNIPEPVKAEQIPNPIIKTNEKVEIKKEEKTLIIPTIDQTKKTITPPASPYYSIKSNQKIETEQSTLTYGNKEERKETIILEIVEVQDKLKKIKDRMGEIIKQKTSLEKEKKDYSGETTEKAAHISMISKKISDLQDEEKTIQKEREQDLPKKYLSLLEELDKMTVHKPSVKNAK